MRHLWAVLLPLCLVTADLAAQQATLSTGARVRVAEPAPNGRTGQAGRWSTGTIEAIDSTSLTLRDARGASLVYPFQAISRIEVSQGQGAASASGQRGLVRGAMAGGIAGVALAGLVALRDEEPCECEALSLKRLTTNSDAGAVVTTVALTSLIGAGIGAVVGSTNREVWTPADVPGRNPLLSVLAAPGRVGLTLRF